MTNQEAIEILKKYKDESEEDYYVKRAEALEKGIKALENQRIGHWERKHNSYTLEHWYKCSECGDCSDYKTPYCQYCGAKMKGDK